MDPKIPKIPDLRSPAQRKQDDNAIALCGLLCVALALGAVITVFALVGGVIRKLWS